MLRVGMLSGWHVHARGYAEELKTIPGVVVTAVWDEEPDRGRAWASDIGAVFEPDLAFFWRGQMLMRWSWTPQLIDTRR